MATAVESGSAGGDSPVARTVCDVLAGAQATLTVVPGELMRKHERRNAVQTPRGKARILSWACLCASLLVAGCTWDQLNPFKPPVPPPPPVESFVLRNGTLVSEPAPREKTAEAELAGAR